MKTLHAAKSSHHNTNRIGNDHESAFGHDIEGIKTSVAQLRSDVTDLMQTAVHAGQTGVAAVQDQASQAIEGLTKTVTSGISNLKKSSAQSMKAVTKKIQDRPVASALVAVGVGYALARFFRRR